MLAMNTIRIINRKEHGRSFDVKCIGSIHQQDNIYITKLMGSQQPKAKVPPLPQKTLKEMVREFDRSIAGSRRQFQREIFKLQSNERKLKAELERMIKKKQPQYAKRMIAQNLLRNQRYMARYQRLDVQLEDMSFQLKTVSTTDTLVAVMKGVGQIMGKTNNSVNVKNIEQAMNMFQAQMEKGQIMNEQIEDALDSGEAEIDDQAADTLIKEMQMSSAGSKGGGSNKERQSQRERERPL